MLSCNLRPNLVGVLLVSFIFLSCNADNELITPRSSYTSVIMPLKVGNKWIYETTLYDSTGAVTKTFLDTLEVIGVTTIDKEQWFITNEDFIMRNSSDGLESAFLIEGEIQNRSLAFKYPGSSGDKWYYDYSTITSIDYFITVPYGRFNCYKYEYTMNVEGTPSVSYFVPGIGSVRGEFISKTPDGEKYIYQVAVLREVSFNQNNFSNRSELNEKRV